MSFALLLSVLLIRPLLAQELNIIPNIVRPYFWSVDQHISINIMANISEKIFNFQRIGLKFEPTILNYNYDFIIVGGGTAGSVIANRLTENNKWTVLLLEAGPPESITNFIPLMAGFLTKSRYDWGIWSEKSTTACFAAGNEQCPFHAGRALGGTSTINHMVHTRGNPEDFEEWKEAGNEGWGYEDVLPYFKKFEAADMSLGFDEKYRGKDGEMYFGYAPYRSAFTDFFVKGAQDVGYDLVDYNGAQQLGVSYMQSNVWKGRRVSAASAFIHPIYKKRKNLHILTSAMVTKIIIDPQTKTALGVEFIRDGQPHNIYAKKEVIISAGALRSPQLLMLAGIGPEDHLKSLGIPVLKDLPVGERFYDHSVFTTLAFVTNTTNLGINIKRIGPLDLLQYVDGKGPLSSPTVEAIAFGKREVSPLRPQQPDFELLLIAGSFASDLGIALAASINVKPNIYYSFKQLENTTIDHFTILVQSMRPKSFGFMKLRDRDIHSHPLFYNNMLTEQDDVESQLEGIRAAIRITQSKTMQSIGTRLFQNELPGCEHLTFNSDNYWRCALRITSLSAYHQTGTCRMGPEDNGESVVDPKLRVHGIKRLRVADNSIIPSMVCAHTQAVALMIGEKISDVIKETWEKYPKLKVNR